MVCAKVHCLEMQVVLLMLVCQRSPVVFRCYMVAWRIRYWTSSEVLDTLDAIMSSVIMLTGFIYAMHFTYGKNGEITIVLLMPCNYVTLIYHCFFIWMFSEMLMSSIGIVWLLDVGSCINETRLVIPICKELVTICLTCS